MRAESGDEADGENPEGKGGGVADRTEMGGGEPGRGASPDEIESAAPPERGGREIQVGVFVLLGLATFLAILFLLTDPATFRGRYMVTTEVVDAGGLRKGDPVQMRGVNIGRVHSFGLTEGGVIITLEIEGEWDIPRGSAASLMSSGLLGGRTVEIVPAPNEEAIPPGGTIPGRNVEGLTDLTGELAPQVRNTLGRAEATLGRLEVLLDEPTVSSLQGSATELRSVLGETASLVREQRLEIAALTESLNRSARGLEAAAGGGEDVARAAARADSVLLQLNRTAGSLDRTAVSLENVMGRLDTGEGTLGRLLNEEDLYRNLNGAAEEIRLLAADVRENPRRYFSVQVF